jgi:hypothetical protein
LEEREWHLAVAMAMAMADAGPVLCRGDRSRGRDGRREPPSFSVHSPLISGEEEGKFQRRSLLFSSG